MRIIFFCSWTKYIASFITKKKELLFNKGDEYQDAAGMVDLLCRWTFFNFLQKNRRSVSAGALPIVYSGYGEEGNA